ncbi:MAG: hypothetical protein A2760_02950 [Candidatus Doudnabacteria bacterium RIFCSPHIGHO2_01_FULL_50_67]|uniref:Uncharacterized protein n=1 Tax=Candidatus Doudnabacteria bacterium RIFCSPHIGHO2_12_FULL_48_16 TaxID=1817838 RepID=A0A1F5PL30_9BACT|nr:MAG: hypothetical protein A3B77_01240 [Candidatus Doudnabacteria bacterium RIFCSPHIGHO2_02_FULL_49_24]OGE89086.1 MAG: hypothetical protein A2760_02950 [Candidatus Doudnabacteria bacterium RIFCSPHIGHO2_01_FULL_50_67]OGE90567.1 MAG: hypothetical protein A3E29_02105 [Candidatus Doudnabacteria bacterium RIFCSPHIGHO2_12_FULL_48_16]OGE97604.1 MAG: hypothetical protein A2990_03160 [Candidatus Doudnabacteria bacterium RIFCSPLOWO2_01_FULL_49_40]OGF03755.1 MAG: hypothetical protein A3H14_03465 [Candid
MGNIWLTLKQKSWFIPAVLTLFGLILFANTIPNQMFWDDNDFILNNQFVHNWSHLPEYFSQNVVAGANIVSNYWRPVLLIVFSVEYHLWGSQVYGYHLVNLFIHIADSILLFYLLRALFKKDSLAFLTALVFLIHPLQTEAVTYVNSLGDSLSVLFMLLGLNNYLFWRQYKVRSSFWWSIAFFPLALMSKETAIVYPGLILLIELFFRNPEFNSRLRNFFYNLWPSVVIAGFYILLRATVLNFQNTFNLYNEQNLFTSHVYVRILTFFKSLWVYLGLLIYPHDLHMERSIEIAQSLRNSQVIAGFALFVILIAAAFWQFKKRPAVSFGCLWFLICLAPVSNILVPINGLLYEHWLYLPMAGFWISFFSILPSPFTGEGAPKGRVRVAQAISILLLIYLVFLAKTTISRNAEWRDPIIFYNQTLRYAPTSYRVINNLGMAYDDDNQHEKAIETYQRAIALNSDIQVAYHNLGNAYKALDRKDLAIENFKLAIEKDPKFTYSYNALIQIYLDDHDSKKALEYLRLLEELYPNDDSIKQLIDQVERRL